MHLDVKRKISKMWPKNFSNRKIILLYHSIGDTPWGMPVAQFTEQIQWISDHCKLFSLSDLIHVSPSQNIQIALTFDDGYSTLYENVLPILDKKKINPMVYINTGWISETEENRKKSNPILGHYPDEYFLTWPEIVELQSAGWEMGSHGVNHYNFTILKKELISEELSLSKRDIEKHLKTTCTHFAYPWGKHSTHVKECLRKAGYHYAFAARHGPLKAKSHALALPRINIANEYSFEDFKNIIYGKWDFLSLIHRMKGL